MSDDNKAILRGIFDEMAKGNSRPLVEAMADDCRWTVAGATRWSKTYAGKQVILNDLFKTLRSKIRGNITTRAERIIADGEYVAVEARGSNTTNAGVPYNNAYCFVFRLGGGKLLEITEYCDTELVTSALGDPRL